MPKTNKELLEVEEVPQARDMTSPRTIFMSTENIENQDVPMTGRLEVIESPKRTFIELITDVIKRFNNTKRTNAMPVPGNMIYGKKTRQIENGGRIKSSEI